MKENQGILCHSDGYHKEEDSSFTTKELSHSTGRGKDADPLALRTLERNDSWNTPELECSAVVNDCSKDNETKSGVLPTKEDQNSHLYHISDCKEDADRPTSDKKGREKFWNTPEPEYSMIMNGFVNHNKHDTKDSGSPFITSSELFQSDTHLYTDKNIIEPEHPELIVCYKEINYHVVKDICVDEGMAVEDKGLTDRHTDDHAAVSLPANKNMQNEISEGGLDFKLFIPNGPKASSQEDIDDHAADKCGTTEERDAVTLVSGKPKCLTESSVNKDGSSPEDLTQTGETKCNAPNKIQNDFSEGETIVTSVLPLQEFGKHSFLRPFIDFLDNDRDDIAQQPKQSLSMEANLESFAAVSKADESNKNAPANKLVYNSKVDNGNVSFDCNSPKPAAADSRGLSAETTEQSLKTDLVLNHNDGNTNNPVAASLVQHANIDGRIVDICQDSIMNPKNRNSSNPFIVNEVENINMDDSTENFDQETIVNLKQANSNNPFAFGEVQSASMEQSSENIYQSPSVNHKKGNFNPFASGEVESANMDRDTENIHQPSMPNPENGKSNNPFAVSELQIASLDVRSESINQPPMLNHEIGRTTNPFTVSEDQSFSTAGGIENIYQQLELKQNDRDSSNPFAISDFQSARIDGITTNIHEKPLKLDNMLDHRDGTGKSFSASNQIQCASSMAENNEVLHEKSFEPQDLPNHEGTSNTISFNDRGQYGIGESSFSAAGPASGRITYSGPMTYSGSTSLRSDSSTTSTRSFAFPVLQSEYNSSPVRMRKADERHFRKHRGWKQGILCCKF